MSCIISMGCPLSANLSNMDLLQRKHPENFGRNRGRGIEKVAFGVQKFQYVWNGVR